MIRVMVFILSIIWIHVSTCSEHKPWTWTTSIFFNHTLKHKQQFFPLNFRKESPYTFTQLICSWNAFRPQHGFYRFLVRVRYADTKRWSRWYRMMDWGKGVAQSYMQKDELSSYHHVRLEIDPQHVAEEYEIKIESHDGAQLGLVKMVSVCVSTFSDFESEKAHEFSHLQSVMISGIPQISQMMLDHPKKEALCSPTSCTMVLNYLLKKKIDPVVFCQKVFDQGLEAYGSWPFNTAAVFEALQGQRFIRVERLASFKNLHSLLKQKIPVIVSVRGWIKGAPQEYQNGHLLVVRGFDAAHKKVLCIDPAFPDHKSTAVSYDLSSFLETWERSRRLAYRLIMPRKKASL